MRQFLLPALLVAVTTGCFGSGMAGKASGAVSRDLILRDEIVAAPEITNAYEAVRRLRPTFLKQRGPTSITQADSQPLVVYLNGVPAGGVAFLRTIPATDIRSIRHLNGQDATTRYGTGHGGGVIEVVTGS